MATDRAHYVVTGAAGRLGSSMVLELAQAGHRVTPLRRSELDIANADMVARTLDRLQPDVLINCSAYNAVDAAEADPALAFAANAHGPAALAAAATRIGAVLVHYSSDFVFDGTATEPYSETAPTHALNVYGASKLAGEHEVAETRRHYILRVESLFGGRPGAAQRATVDMIAANLMADKAVKAIVDRTVTPSYVPDVVRVTTTLLKRSAPFGTYHCVASGSTTWYELAQEIARVCGGAGRVVPVEAAAFPTLAPRPRFCALSNEKLLRLGIHIPSWRTALRDHLLSRGAPSLVESLRARTA